MATMAMLLISVTLISVAVAVPMPIFMAFDQPGLSASAVGNGQSQNPSGPMIASGPSPDTLITNSSEHIPNSSPSRILAGPSDPSRPGPDGGSSLDAVRSLRSADPNIPPVSGRETGRDPSIGDPSPIGITRAINARNQDSNFPGPSIKFSSPLVYIVLCSGPGPGSTVNRVTENPITEHPITENPITENPITENLITENPITENPITGDPNFNTTPVDRPKDGVVDTKFDVTKQDDNNNIAPTEPALVLAERFK